MQLFTIFAMLFTAGGVMFAFQNNVPVTVNFFMWRFDSSLAMVMLLALVTGGNRGIGFGFAEALSQAGASVAIWGSSEANNAAAVKRLPDVKPVRKEPLSMVRINGRLKN